MEQLRKLQWRGVGLLALALGGTGCGGDAAPAGEALPDLSDPDAIEWAPALGIDLDAMTRTDSGLRILDEQVGEGDPVRAGQAVRVHYTGWLPDGRTFDSSVDRGLPFDVPQIGSGMVIRGWEEGLQGMRPGGRRLLVIPPHLAYGPSGAGGGIIPPNTSLVFRVELLSILP